MKTRSDSVSAVDDFNKTFITVLSDLVYFTVSATKAELRIKEPACVSSLGGSGPPDLPLWDTGCAESMLGLVNVQPQGSVQDRLKVSWDTTVLIPGGFMGHSSKYRIVIDARE